MRKIVLLGATGSIGKSTFELVRRNPDKFQIVGASAHSHFSELEKMAGEFGINNLLNTRGGDSCGRSDQGRATIKDCPYKEFLKKCEPDIVLNAVTGFAGLKFSMETLKQEIPLALANKESLVTGGKIIMALSREMKTPIIPVDSEHSAIFECLVKNYNPRVNFSTPGLNFPEYKAFHKILLTCSGGPFFGKTRKELEVVTLAQALKHPNWDMGAGITIDSATLANKCLEFFEAMHLFNATKDQIEIVIHRESIVHSMVEFSDSSILAQMAPPNMELPIGMALNYPDKMDYQLPRQSFKNLNLSFAEPDKEVFKTLQLLDICADNMENFPIVFNAAKEVLVSQFLKEQIRFIDIFDVLEEVIHSTKLESIDSIEKILEVDRRARDFTRLQVDKIAI